MAESDREPIRVPVVWVGAEDVPVLAANQMVVQHSAQDEFILTFGHLTPPVVLGTPQQRQEQLERMTFVAIKPVARVGFNRQRLEELSRILQEHLRMHDDTTFE